MNNEPIFIIGAPRSGTTLLAAMLAAHSRMSCGPETHFFRWLAQENISLLLSDTNWPDKAVDFLCSISRKTFDGGNTNLLIEKYLVNNQDLETSLLKRDKSIASILSALTENYMLIKGKKRWVEKTPDHIQYLHMIRQYFPRAYLVRIIRDPRDVSLSLMKVPWGVSTLVEGLNYWRKLDDLSKDFCEKDNRSYTLKYEELVANSAQALMGLCTFLGEEFEDRMLDTSQTGKDLNSRSATWKSNASKPPDLSRIFTWKKELTEQEICLAEAIIGDKLVSYGYPMESDFKKYAEVYPREFVAKEGFDISLLASSGFRFWSISSSEPPGGKIYLGDPVDWITSDVNGLRRILLYFRVCINILLTILSRQVIYWIPGANHPNHTGLLSNLIKKILVKYEFSSTQ